MFIGYLVMDKMNRQEILDILFSYKNEKKERFNLEQIGIFGSVAKNEFHMNSDIDVVVKLSKPDIFILGNIKVDLESLFNRKVDIVRIREKMNLFLKRRIQKEAIYV
jgi:predicted nucleotidyltransferase